MLAAFHGMVLRQVYHSSVLKVFGGRIDELVEQLKKFENKKIQDVPVESLKALSRDLEIFRTPNEIETNVAATADQVESSYTRVKDSVKNLKTLDLNVNNTTPFDKQKEEYIELNSYI